MFKSWKKFEGSDRVTVITLAVFCVVAILGIFLIR
jgi:hypothetical protein